MGKSNAEAYGRRNSGEGAVLVRIKPTRIIGEKRHSRLGLINEKSGNRGINEVEITKTPGMLLSISLEPDLLHTSILYYHRTMHQRNI
jgi:hypothetical protein